MEKPHSPACTVRQRGERTSSETFLCLQRCCGPGDELRSPRFSLSRLLTTRLTCFLSLFQLGILSSGPPFLITTFRPCPRGTNGGISAWGTLVSFLGGLLVGFLAVVSLLWQGQQSSCGGYVWMLEILAVAGMSGLGGSIVSPARTLSIHRVLATVKNKMALTVKRPSTARLSPRRRLPAYLLLEDQVARRSFTNARSRKSDWGGDRARTGVGMGCPLQQRRECALDLGHRRRGGVVCVLISSSYHDHHSYRPSHGELPPTSAKVRPRVMRILGARLSFSPVLRLAPPPPSLTSSAFYHSKSPTCLP